MARPPPLPPPAHHKCVGFLVHMILRTGGCISTPTSCTGRQVLSRAHPPWERQCSWQHKRSPTLAHPTFIANGDKKHTTHAHRQVHRYLGTTISDLPRILNSAVDNKQAILFYFILLKGCGYTCTAVSAPSVSYRWRERSYCVYCHIVCNPRSFGIYVLFLRFLRSSEGHRARSSTLPRAILGGGSLAGNR